jgi:hypothetical protein
MGQAQADWRYCSGGWGGFKQSAVIALLKPDAMASEIQSYLIANGAQVVCSMLYLLLIYNITLVSMERDWGMLETARARIRCTLHKGKGFYQSYLLQLPKRILFPVIGGQISLALSDSMSSLRQPDSSVSDHD